MSDMVSMSFSRSELELIKVAVDNQIYAIEEGVAGDDWEDHELETLQSTSLALGEWIEFLP